MLLMGKEGGALRVMTYGNHVAKLADPHNFSFCSTPSVYVCEAMNDSVVLACMESRLWCSLSNFLADSSKADGGDSLFYSRPPVHLLKWFSPLLARSELTAPFCTFYGDFCVQAFQAERVYLSSDGSTWLPNPAALSISVALSSTHGGARLIVAGTTTQRQLFIECVEDRIRTRYSFKLTPEPFHF